MTLIWTAERRARQAERFRAFNRDPAFVAAKVASLRETGRPFPLRRLPKHLQSYYRKLRKAGIPRAEALTEVYRTAEAQAKAKA